MLTGLRIKNFKGLEDVEIELGQAVVFVGPNNSGKTTALQALALWEIGLRKWLAAQSMPYAFGVAINRRDLIAVPVPTAELLWRNLQFLGDAVEKPDGNLEFGNTDIEIEVQGVTERVAWTCDFNFTYANGE